MAGASSRIVSQHLWQMVGMQALQIAARLLEVGCSAGDGLQVGPQAVGEDVLGKAQGDDGQVETDAGQGGERIL